MTVAGVLLAAGAGSRFTGETHKLLALVGDRTVFELALSNMGMGGFDQLVVVTGCADVAALLTNEVTAVHNPNWADGQATSLAVAVDLLARTSHEAAVFGLADQPGVTGECWSALRTSTAPLAAATVDGRRSNPVRLHRSVWGELPRYGDFGARHVLQARSAEVEAVPCLGRSDDIDTTEDLRSWN